MYPFNPKINILPGVLIWQYDQTKALGGLIKSKNKWYEDIITQTYRDWYNNVFNLLTANDFGLDVWSIILNLPLSMGNEPDSPEKKLWGFDINPPAAPISNNQNFNHGNFTTTGQGFNLSTEEKRFILRLRYFSFVSRGTIPDANQFFLKVYPEAGYPGQMYLVDNKDMTLTLFFTEDPGDKLIRILQVYNEALYNLIPRPVGVKLFITIL